jgi:RNA polymerase sigma factor (sigma-70 family)
MKDKTKAIKQVFKCRESIYPAQAVGVCKTLIKQIKEPDDAIKRLLIEQSYFFLEQEHFVERNIIGLCNAKNTPLDWVPDIVLWVQQKLEENDLKNLMRFNERSKFTTFLISSIHNRFIDFLRKDKRINNYMERVALHTENFMNLARVTPETFNIIMEEEVLKKKIAALLPGIIVNLDKKEQTAFKLYYYKSTPISAIARTLGTTDYKAKKTLKKAMDYVLSRLKDELT